MNTNFTIREEREIPYKKSTVTYLVHEKTGLKILYFKWPRKLNYFSFNFKVPVENDTGISHILEHCIFRGSKKYPVKDLLTVFEKTSPNYMMNAFTSTNWTSFLASTYVKKDFYNLLDVYGDSVFFPLLRQETFDQEGWHYDIDKSGNLSINGVVYNEVNTLSNKLSVQINKSRKKFFKGSSTLHNCGGLPDKIPEVTREKVVELHQKYYVPGNCLLVLCNNLPLEEQLDFLEKNLLYKLPSGTESAKIENKIVPISKTLHSTIKMNYIGKGAGRLDFSILSPDGTEEECLERDCFYDFIRNLMLEKICFLNPYCSNGNIFSTGMDHYNTLRITLDGVRKQDKRKAEKYILKALNEYYEEGFEKEKILQYVYTNDLNYNNFEVVNMDPDSVTEIAICGWRECENPMAFMYDDLKAWNKQKEKYLSENSQEYFKYLLKRYVLDEKHRMVTYMTGDKKLIKRLDRKQNKAINKIIKSADVQKVIKRKKELEDFLNKPNDEQIIKNLPSLELSDLQTPEMVGRAVYEEVPVKIKSNGKENSANVRLYSSEQDLKDLVSFEIYFPCDTLTEREYKIFDSFSCFFDNFGFGNKASNEIGLIIDKSSMRNLERGVKGFCDSVYADENDIIQNRNWYAASFVADCSKLKESLDVFNQFMFDINLDNNLDMKRACKKIEQVFNSMEYGNEDSFLHYEVNSSFSKYAAFDKKMYGVERLEWLPKLRNKTPENLLQKTFKIYKKVLDSGAVISVFAAKEKLPEVKEVVKNYIQSANLKPLSEKILLKSDDINDDFSEKDNNEKEICTVITKDVSAGSVLMVMKSSPYPSKECVAEHVLLKWLNNNDFHNQVRLTNGAYYINGSIQYNQNLILFRTRQDPNPAKSVELIEKILKNAVNVDFSEEEIKNTIIKLYSDAYEETNTLDEGYFEFRAQLIGLKSEFREARLKNLLDITPKDVHEAALRVYEASKHSKIGILTGDETQVSGKVIFDARKIV